VRNFSLLLLCWCFEASIAVAQLRPVALESASADNGGIGEALSFTAFSLPTINRHGEVAFTALVQSAVVPSRGGVWSDAGGDGLKLVVLDGREAPGVPNGVFSNIQDTYGLINDQGQTAFRGRLVTASGITAFSNSGIWIASAGGSTELILREGDQAPPTAGVGAVFNDTGDVAGNRYSAFNNQGRVAMQTSLQMGSGGITGNNDWGVWSAGGGYATREAGREGTVAPGVSPTRLYQIINTFPSLNDNGKTIFRAPLTNSLGGTANGTGIWIDDPLTGVSLVAVQGAVAPGTGGVSFNNLNGVMGINNSDEYAFSGTLQVGGSVDSLNDLGIWAMRHGNPQALLYREAQHAPGTGAAAGFSTFTGLRMNSEGHIAFSATLAGIPGAGESGITQFNNMGVWSEGIDGTLQMVARENENAPGTPVDILFSVFFEPTINEPGQTAFLAEVRGPGITAANNQGLWAQDVEGDLHLIARRGDALDVDPGPGVDERIVLNLAFWSDGGGEDGRRTGLNAYGQIAFAAAFTDGSSGIFVSDLVANKLAGDFDSDGDVDGRDFLVWQRNPAVGDLADWQANYGTGALSAFSSCPATEVASPVPEPSAFVLALLGCYSLSRKRLSIRRR
jgi:hypothetical protein